MNHPKREENQKQKKEKVEKEKEKQKNYWASSNCNFLFVINDSNSLK